MQVVIINLAERTDRREAMKRRLSGLDVSFEFFDACKPGKIPERVYDFLYNKNTNKYWCPQLRPGEIGVYASHLEIMLRIMDGVYDDHILILEDDAIVNEENIDIIKFIYSNMKRNEKMEMVNLYSKGFYVAIESCRLGGIQLVRNWIPSACMHAYLLSREGARKFMDFRKHRISPVDKDIKFAAWKAGLRLWEVTSPIVLQDQSSESSITGRKKRRFPRYRHEFDFACQYFGRRYMFAYSAKRILHKVMKKKWK